MEYPGVDTCDFMIVIDVIEHFQIFDMLDLRQY